MLENLLNQIGDSMKIKLSKSQWEGIGKKAGWVKASQAISTTEPQIRTTFKGLAGWKRTALIHDDGLLDGGVRYTDEEMDLMEKQDKDAILIERIKSEVAKIVDEFGKNLLSKEGFELRIKEMIKKMYEVKGIKPNPNVE